MLHFSTWMFHTVATIAGLLALSWQWWQNLTHTWTTDRFDSESPQLLLNSCGQIILLTFSIPIKVVITKTTLGWADLLVIIFSKVCHLLVGGKRYSLIRVLISFFPHRIRQSRSEEKHLALIPLILRYTEHKLNYLTSCTICLNKITNMDINPNEKRSKPKPTASSPRAVLMLSLTLNPSWLSRERERERSFIYRNHCWLLLCESVTSCFFGADKALVEFALFYCPRTNSHWGMYVSLYFSVISQDTELNERR